MAYQLYIKQGFIPNHRPALSFIVVFFERGKNVTTLKIFWVGDIGI